MLLTVVLLILMELILLLINLKLKKKALEMPLINYEINFDLNWSKKCIIVATNIANQGATFSTLFARL